MQDQFAIVVSEFNRDITEKLLEGALSRLKECRIKEKNIFVIKVPGAVEIPLVAKLLARSKKYDAIICLGAVICGDTDHYDYVCQQVSQGCQRVMMEFDIPVIFGVLTTQNEQQAKARVKKGNNKGVEAVDTAIEMIRVIQLISS